jgi:hypothetical protein
LPFGFTAVQSLPHGHRCVLDLAVFPVARLNEAFGDGKMFLPAVLLVDDHMGVLIRAFHESTSDLEDPGAVDIFSNSNKHRTCLLLDSENRDRLFPMYR